MILRNLSFHLLEILFEIVLHVPFVEQLVDLREQGYQVRTVVSEGKALFVGACIQTYRSHPVQKLSQRPAFPVRRIAVDDNAGLVAPAEVLALVEDDSRLAKDAHNHLRETERKY